MDDAAIDPSRGDAAPMSGLFVGLMSGTSLDAVDGALVRFDAGQPETLRFASAPIPCELRAELLALQSPSVDEIDRAEGWAIRSSHEARRATEAGGGKSRNVKSYFVR